MDSVLILSPLAVEHAALSGAMGKSLKGVELAVGGHGKVQFALSTQLLIQKYNPRLVICAGAAGRLDHSVKLLDVMVSEATVEHDFNLRFVDRPLPRFACDERSLDRLRRVNDWPFGVHFGIMASGDEDVLDSERGDQIRRLTEARAVAWEGAGAARACKLHGVPYLEVRVITDGAAVGAVQEFSENVKKGMVHVADVIRRLL